MGSTQSTQATQYRDAAIPADWGGAEGLTARGDSQALKRGHYRLYQFKALKTLESSGFKSEFDQAKLIAKLADLPKASGLSDVTEAAAQRGVALSELARLRFGNGKFTQPNKLLGIGLGTHNVGLVMIRIAVDQPKAATDATLYCISVDSVQSVAVSVGYFGQIKPDALINIKEDLCGK